MAFQGEREPGVVGMDLEMVESMVQDEIPEQDISVQDQFLPQPNPEPEMGAAAAAVDDTSSSAKTSRSLLNRLSRAHPTWPS